MDLTDTQRTILGLIADGVARDGMPPSQAEIARAMGFSGVRCTPIRSPSKMPSSRIESPLTLSR